MPVRAAWPQWLRKDNAVSASEYPHPDAIRDHSDRRLDLAERPSEVRRQIGVTFQSPAVDVRLTVEENLIAMALCMD